MSVCLLEGQASPIQGFCVNRTYVKSYRKHHTTPYSIYTDTLSQYVNTEDKLITAELMTYDIFHSL